MTSNSTLVPKLLLVPAPGVHCRPRSVLGEVVFDDIGRSPAGSSAKREAVRGWLLPHPPDFQGKVKKFHFRKFDQRNEHKIDENIKKTPCFFCLFV